MKNNLLSVSASIVGLAIILFFAFNWFKEFTAIDSCLDHGGRWNYDLGECEFCDVDSSKESTYYWKADYDEDRGEFLIRGKMLDSIPKTPYALIAILNKRDLECSIKLEDIWQDTITINIVNGLYLSEQMGTTGAYCFLGETVFTLTELDSIGYVQIEMEVGSHAGPGVYTRDDFANLVRK